MPQTYSPHGSSMKNIFNNNNKKKKEYYKFYAPLMSRCNKIERKKKSIYMICTVIVNLIFWEYVFKLIVVDTDANCHRFFCLLLFFRHQTLYTSIYGLLSVFGDESKKKKKKIILREIRWHFLKYFLLGSI